MRVVLVNPPWSFAGSIYFGCREPHLPLELGYAAALLERAGHRAVVRDAALGLRPALPWRDGVARLADWIESGRRELVAAQ